MQTIRVGTEPQHLTLTLELPHILRGRVVDSAGRPVGRAALSVQSWRGSRSLEQEVTTDADGRFLWKEAPGDEVRVGVDANGYVRKRDVPAFPGAQNQIVLASPTTVKGTVVDAETGRSISDFSLMHGAVNVGRRLIWQRGGPMDEQAKKAPGWFEYTFREQADQLIVRVEAKGYLPMDSGLFAQDGAIREFPFRLTKADPIRGILLNHDGSPARDGLVYLVPAGDDFKLRNDHMPEEWRKRWVHAQVSPRGLYTLPPQKADWLLVALSDAGYAVVHQRDLANDNTLRLQPWVRVTGIVKFGTKPAAELDLHLKHENADSPTPEDESRIFRQFDFTTDADGRFRLARVTPGRYDVIREVLNGVGRIDTVKMAAPRFGRRPLLRPNDRRHRSPYYRSTRAPSGRHLDSANRRDRVEDRDQQAGSSRCPGLGGWPLPRREHRAGRVQTPNHHPRAAPGRCVWLGAPRRRVLARIDSVDGTGRCQ